MVNFNIVNTLKALNVNFQTVSYTYNKLKVCDPNTPEVIQRPFSLSLFVDTWGKNVLFSIYYKSDQNVMNK